MALAVSIPTGYGVPATYHMISLVSCDRLSGTCTMAVMGYADEAARRAGAAPLLATTLAIDGAQCDGITDTERYALLKADPRWAEATDC